MEPWGTPEEILLRAENLPLNSTYCVLANNIQIDKKKLILITKQLE